jgi:hypothetical protein
MLLSYVVGIVLVVVVVVVVVIVVVAHQHYDNGSFCRHLGFFSYYHVIFSLEQLLWVCAA